MVQQCADAVHTGGCILVPNGVICLVILSIVMGLCLPMKLILPDLIWGCGQCENYLEGVLYIHNRKWKLSEHPDILQNGNSAIEWMQPQLQWVDAITQIGEKNHQCDDDVAPVG